MSFKSFTSKDLEDEKRIIIVFATASWCGPCKSVKHWLPDEIKAYPNVRVRLLDVDKEADYAGKFDIEAMPTLIFLKNGKELDRVKGNDIKEFRKLARKLC